MKNNFYKYSILKYKHNAFLDESINIGLLIYFENYSKFSFKFSKNLSRIKSIYENVPEKTIKEYLKRIEIQIKKFNLENDIFQSSEVKDLSTFISKNFLANDSSSLRFTNPIKNSQNDFDNKFIEDTLTDKFLIHDIIQTNSQPKEPKLLQKYFSSLKGLDFNEINKFNKKFYFNYELENETGNVFNFDYAWQNGTLNLVKPISFDLKESKSIADKAYKNLGQFIDLENNAKNKNLRFDFILGKPSSKFLFKEYDHAVKLLEKIKFSEIIDEDEIEQYAKRTKSELMKNL
jgi:hypothetical protein